ncbi:hypothetical protein QDX21_07065 [Auritidibacter ignavus]|uniref:HK97 gp10 family phage protein n=1 Tax=Auritidibacter ignavus TaxID=678932 RepID=A0AAJ6AL65_9MICC|nr:hypothetical protein [Auritidibacter ignavus]WGH92095.1 hypothetical protein QDX21_07065 [Auritidibacter ignavus]
MSSRFFTKEVRGAIERGVTEGLNAGAYHLLQETVPRTPKESGALRSSLQVAEAEIGFPVAVVYSDSVYANWQHENMGAHHTVGQAKFLESAANDERRRIAEIINQQIRGHAS